MLTLPVYDQLGDSTIYRDSKQDYVFYAVPNIPTLRYDTAGRATFQFLKYQEAARRVDDSAERGGGYVQFDCEFKVPEAELDEIRQTLQNRINRKYRQLGSTPPKVVLAPPTYQDGAVKLLTFEENTGGIIEHVAGAGKPSLTGSNVAAFSAELSERGAALLWEAFQMPTLPIAVAYDLKLLARVPALEMHIWLKASQLHSYWEEITQEIDERVWGDTEEDYQRTVRESFSKHQAAGVDIVDWPAEFAGGPDGEKFKQQMIEWGWGMLEDAFADALGDRFVPETETGGIGDFRHVTRETIEEHITDIKLYVKRQSVITWHVAPQAHLQGFLQTPGPNGRLPNRDDFFREIRLDDAFFRMLGVSARCNADFENDPIYAVKLHIEYGERIEEFVFKDSNTVHSFQAFVDPQIGRKYRYWTEITYKNRERTYRSPTITTDETQLILSFGTLGYLKFDVIAGDFDWKYIDHAQVRIRYGDPANRVSEEENVVQLHEDASSVTYERIIWAPVTKDYAYKIVYFLRDGQQVDRDWVASSQTPLIVNDVFESRLIVKLLGSGSFQRINRIITDLEYRNDARDYEARKTYSLTAEQPELVWTVPLWDDAPETFRYRTIVSYQDGHSVTSEWEQADGSQTLTVGEVFADFLDVDILTDLIDFSETRLAKVSLHYHDPANAIDEVEDFVFTKARRDGQSWRLPIKDKNHREYGYEALYFMADGSRRQVPKIMLSDETIVLEVPADKPASLGVAS